MVIKRKRVNRSPVRQRYVWQNSDKGTPFLVGVIGAGQRALQPIRIQQVLLEHHCYTCLVGGPEDLLALVVLPVVQNVLHEDAVALGNGGGVEEVSCNELHLYIDERNAMMSVPLIYVLHLPLYICDVALQPPPCLSLGINNILSERGYVLFVCPSVELCWFALKIPPVPGPSHTGVSLHGFLFGAFPLQ